MRFFGQYHPEQGRQFPKPIKTGQSAAFSTLWVLLLSATSTSDIGSAVEKLVYSWVESSGHLPQSDRWPFLVAAGIIGFLAASRNRFSSFLVYVLLGTAIWPAFEILSASILEVRISSLFPALTTASTASLVYFINQALFTLRRQKIHSAFGENLPPQRIHEIVAHPHSFSTQPAGRNISILFIDLVDFSIVAERLEPLEAVTMLQYIHNSIRQSVHRYGGTVDRTMGDNILCYFGYDYNGKKIFNDHHLTAVRCAVEIQRIALQRNMVAKDSGHHTFPLRIGIHSDYMFVGDIGTPKTPEFTLIGNGIEFAQKLKNHCDNYSIMIGASTHDAIDHLSYDGISINKRFLKSEGNASFIEAYQIDPFANEPDQIVSVLNAYREKMGINRREQRIPISDGLNLPILTEFCGGKIVNFSEEGLAISIPKYIGKGVYIHALIGEENSDIRNWSKENNLSPIIAEIRWGRPYGNEYLHGLHIKNMDKQQTKDFYKKLREFNKTERSHQPNSSRNVA